MLIAIIDGGVEASVLEGIQLKEDLNVDASGLIRKRRKNERIVSGHGSICASIIGKYAPDAKFCSIRIFNKKELRTNHKKLIAALEWCYKEKIPIVHLSVGTGHLSDYKVVRNIVSKMIKKHQIIVAAHSNTDLYSIPASLAGMFGVEADKEMAGSDFKIIQDEIRGVVIKASSKHKLKFSEGDFFDTQITNSYAAPTVTAAIFNLISKEPLFSFTVPQVFELLGSRRGGLSFMKPDFLTEAYLFNPYGYEILKEHLFFDCLSESKGIEEMKGKGVVFLPSSDNDETSEMLTLISKNEIDLKAVIYGGIMNSHKYLMRRKEFFWCESSIKNNEEDAEAKGSLEVPVVNFYGESVYILDLLCCLRDLFLEEGYQCVGVSSARFSYLYGLELIRQEDSISIRVEQIVTLYRPDIMLVNIGELDVLNIEKDSIFNVFSDDESLIEKYSGGTEASCEILTAESAKLNSVKLYNEVTKYFSKEHKGENEE